MANKSSTTKSPRPDASAQVAAFLAALDHPLKPVILALRELILSVDPSISEEIKWNAPSFRTTEHFATFNLRASDSVKIVMHLGAKPRGADFAGVTIHDPDSVLTLIAKDRATVTFRDLADVEARGAAFATIIRQWIAFV